MAYSDPLAYFLTWTTYGTWLPGDQRGWFDHSGQWSGADEHRRMMASLSMTENACKLDRDQRILVEATIARHCQVRGWKLHAVNCRTNHVHVVVTAPGYHPDTVRDQFKSWCTSGLKEHQRKRHPGSVVRTKWWTERGSQRWINDEEGLNNLIE